ncbi:hypothetical protein PCO87_13930 [Pectobacteriaceae bacterium C52]|uniref:hypothetical protein n=1 Tax=Brenneria uluponensis TaxID=3057057 RepID=UPI0028E8F2AC|nr:hypothetical protein [Brenneria ulupoensis]WJV61022.1 hypothetical protein PCO87_13930 [Pectobacteriaceae bacterium C52]
MNKLARLLLTASSIAPVCLTLMFIGWMEDSTWLLIYSFYTCVTSWVLCISLIKFAKCKLETLYKNISTLSPANKEVTNYFLSYLFPLLGTGSIAENKMYAIFFYISLLIYISFSENYNFNPVLSLHGYKFYEAEDDTGVGFVLISKEIITDIKNKSFSVVQLTDYTYLHIKR